MSFSSTSLAKCIRRLIPVFSLLCAATFVGFSYSEVSASPTTDVTTGLVAYWNFNNASAIGQSTTGGTPLIAENGAQYTANGKFGGGLLLNGNSQMLSSATGTIDNLPIGNSSYTQSVWFKPAALGDKGFIGWGNYNWGDHQVNALRMFGGNGGFRHYWWGNDLDSDVPLSIGTWYHVASTFDGTTRKLYLNGALLVSDSPGGRHNVTAEKFAIGRTCDWCNEFFDGVLDDVAIYNVALSASSIAALALTSPTTTTTTTTTTTVPPTTTTTVAPVLEIVVIAPVTTVAAPIGQIAIPTVGSTAAVISRNTSSTTIVSPTTTEVTQVKNADKPTPPSIGVAAPGEAAVTVGEESQSATVTRIDNQLTVTAGKLSATVGGMNKDGGNTALDADGNVRLKSGDVVRIKLAGFDPGSTAEAWLFSTPQLMGRAKVGPDGIMVGNFAIPQNVSQGSHRIAIVAPVDGKPATLAVGIKVGELNVGTSFTVWLIVLPIILAMGGALVLPAVIRRRRYEG
jgi:hypothetical protein